MAWCFSTRASVTTVLTMHLYISSFLWVKPKDFSCHFKIYCLLVEIKNNNISMNQKKMFLSSILCLWHDINIWTYKYLFIDNVTMKWKFCHLDKVNITGCTGCHYNTIVITGCTDSCHFDNFQCSQWWKLCQNDHISPSVWFHLNHTNYANVCLKGSFSVEYVTAQNEKIHELTDR